MAFTAIASAAVQAGKAVTQTLMDLIRTNFDDHESRIVALEAATIVNGFIVGEIRIWTNSSLPSGFLWCDGSAVSRTVDYDDLFATIGTTFGVGDGSTTFNLPDLRGRVPVGKDDMNNTAGTGGGAASRVTTAGSGVDGATLAAVGGAQNHTLVAGEMPVHTHTVTDPGHTHTEGGHTHNLLDVSGGAGAGNYITPTGTIASTYTAKSGMVQTTTITINSNTTGITNQNAGSGGAHYNMQPSLVCNYVIRYLAN
jgi:microcystin-dependent protein